MNATKKPAKVKGAVLIMILAVMTVLIILLAGSIAVVYSAHNRATVKYNETQGYYTARSILDNFKQDLFESKDFQGSDGADVGEFWELVEDKTKAQSNPMCQGRALELQLYKPRVAVKEGGNYVKWFKDYCEENRDAMVSQLKKFNTTLTDSALSGAGLYNYAEQYYVNLDKSNLADYSTENLRQHYDQFTALSSGGDTIRYEIDGDYFKDFASGTIDGKNAEYGKLADKDGTKAWVDIQIIERIFAFGKGDSYAECFKNGFRGEDHIVAKMTAHVIYDGEEVTTTQTWVSAPPPIVTGDKGIESLGGIGGNASVTALGGCATLHTGYTDLTNNSTYSGSMYYEGSFGTGTTTPDVTMSEENSDSLFVGGTFVVTDNTLDASKLYDGVIIYARRALLRGQSGHDFGSATTRINLITKQFEKHKNQAFYGNIYAERFDVNTDDSVISTSFVRNASETGGTAFTSLDKSIHGNIYCNYLGVPASSVYIKAVGDEFLIKVNADPVTGAAFTDEDPRNLIHIFDDSDTMSKIYVFNGISLINGTEEHHEYSAAGGLGAAHAYELNAFVNTHQKFKIEKGPANYVDCENFVDYFRSAIDEDGSVISKFETEAAFVPRDSDTNGSEVLLNTIQDFKVRIDWSNLEAYDCFVNKTNDTLKPLKIGYDTETPNADWTLDADFKKEFKLPNLIFPESAKLAGSGDLEYTLPTHRSTFGKYFYATIKGGTTGKVDPLDSSIRYTFDDGGMFTVKPKFQEPGGIPDPEAQEFEKFKDEHGVDAEALYSGITTDDPASPVDISALPPLPVTTTPATVGAGGGDTVNGIDMPSNSRVISSDGYIVPNGSTYFIDARESDVNLQLGDINSMTQTFTGTLVVYGNNNVQIIVPGFGYGNPTPVTWSETVNMGTTGAGFTVITPEIRDTPKIIIGDADESKNTTPPNIDWFIPKNVKTNHLAKGGGGETVLCGYICSPKTNFVLDTSMNGMPKPVSYFGVEIPSGNSKFNVYGSICCASYRGGQHAGVCFIPRDKGFTDSGNEPVIKKKGIYRSRR